MKQFEYHVRREGEAEVVAQMPAVDEATARAELVSLGFEVLSIAELKSSQTSAAVAAGMALPLDEVLLVLADETEDRRLGSAARRVAAKLKKGATVEQALAEVEQTGPRYLAAILGAATSGADLSGVCENFQKLRQSAWRTRQSLAGLMIYPLLLASALLGLALLASVWLVPQFDDLFREFDLELPPYTQSIITGAPYFPWIIGGGLIAWLGISALPMLTGRGFRLRSALPAIGHLYSQAAQEQFSHTLASFLHIRVPLADALRYTSDLIDDRSLARTAAHAAQAVEQGGTLSQVLAGSRDFDRTLPILVGWGEHRSHLAKSLDLAGEMFGDSQQRRVLLLRRIVPSITLVMVAASALSVAGALFIPLVKLIEGLS